MITTNASKIAQQLQEYKKEVKRKLEGMVAKFAYEVTLKASESTPMGDPSGIDSNARYRRYYEKRSEDYGLPIEAGWHRSAWVFSKDASIPFTPSLPIANPIQVASDVQYDVNAGYRLGQSFYIGATGPDFTMLGNGVNRYPARTTIGAPTIQYIQSVVEARLDDYYRSS